MILKCSCEHDYQDKKYGKLNRVFVPTIKGAKCSVCDRTISDDRLAERKAQKKQAKK